jgi:hypothetical protein
MDAAFRPDTHIAEVAAAYALDAVELSTSAFHLTLDFSEDSIALLEVVLGKMHESLAARRPQEDRIWTFAKTFGSYLGEVFRRAHGGEWGMVTAGRETFPGLRCEPRGLTFSPWMRAHLRILRGPEESVREFYRSLLLGS